jgi:poly-beta-1,6-N-acetyl-D-glucosamine synthase
LTNIFYMIIPILKLIFITATITQLVYWVFVFSKLAFYEKISNPNSANHVEGGPSVFLTEKPVSVVICARNEAINLENNLPHILNQDYPNYEVLVVNDASNDNSADILAAFEKQYPHLKVLTIYDKKMKGKKGALALGIESSTHELLLLTDADCYPLSKNWISSMVNTLGHKNIGLGYAPYKSSDSLLNRFIRFETVWTATQYMGFALAGMPYMGVGRNIIYTKNLYRFADGFKKHEKIMSGDDDLFVNSIITKNNFEIILNPETFMYSLPNTRWNGYITQKKRHFATATSYILKHQIILGILSLSHFLHFVTAVLLLILKVSTIFVILFILIRWLTIFTFYGKIFKKFQETDLLPSVLFLDVAYVFFYIVFAPALAAKAHKWQ